MVYLTHNTNERKVMNLGIMNGWREQPKEYTKHLAECGTEYTYKCAMGKPGVYEMRTGRRHDMTVTRKGNCYTGYKCNECGISYSVDSSG